MGSNSRLHLAGLADVRQNLDHIDDEASMNSAISVVLFICASYVPHEECNRRTARAFREEIFRGVVCGLPYQNPLTSGPLSKSEDEYVLMRCEMRRP